MLRVTRPRKAPNSTTARSRAKAKQEEQVILTLSSDEEDENSTNHTSQVSAKKFIGIVCFFFFHSKFKFSIDFIIFQSSFQTENKVLQFEPTAKDIIAAIGM